MYLRADLGTCLDRNRQREDPTDEAAIHIVCREFEQPDADLTIDVTERSPEEVAALETLPEDHQPSAVDSDGEIC